MSKVMYKYCLFDSRLPITGVSEVSIPTSAEIKHIAMQNSQYGFGIMAWAEVVENTDLFFVRKFSLIATGERVPDRGEYLITVEYKLGTIWHLYELKE